VAQDSGKDLFRIVRNPVTEHFPPDCAKYGLSVSGNLVHPTAFVNQLDDDRPVVFAIGAQEHGKVEADWVDDWISISQYALSSACCINRLLTAFETKYEVL